MLLSFWTHLLHLCLPAVFIGIMVPIWEPRIELSVSSSVQSTLCIFVCLCGLSLTSQLCCTSHIAGAQLHLCTLDEYHPVIHILYQSVHTRAQASTPIGLLLV